MFLLEIKDLRCTPGKNSGFRSGRKREELLHGVTLGVEPGASVALLGESGSGKTTLARCIAGLERPDSGTISFNGVNIYPETKRRKEIGTDIQMLFQASGASLDPRMTVSDSLSEGLSPRNGRSPGIREQTEALVASVGLSGDCLGRLPSQLSGGERQRVALARVLAVAPRLLVLDEPTSALDTLTSAQLLQLLKSAQSETGIAFLLITHDVRTALSFCDRTALLHGGVIVEEGSSAALRAHPRHEYTRRLFEECGIAAGAKQPELPRTGG